MAVGQVVRNFPLMQCWIKHRSAHLRCVALAAGEGVFRNKKQRLMTSIYVETLVVAASNKPRMALRFPVHQLTILCIHIQCQCVCVCAKI